MAVVFNPSTQESVDFSKWITDDLTGLYNVVSNTGGWGLANPPVGTATTCTLVITKVDLSTLLPSANVLDQYTKDVWFGAAGGVLPNTVGDQQFVTALEMGYADSKLPSGIYAYNIFGAGDDGGDIYSFSKTGFLLSTGAVECCITKMRNKANIKDCGACFDKNSMASNARLGSVYIQGAKMAFKHGLYDGAASFLKRANEICNKCAPCKC